MVAAEQHLYQTIVLSRKHATGSTHDYFFCYYPLVAILFEGLRIVRHAKVNQEMGEHVVTFVYSNCIYYAGVDL